MEMSSYLDTPRAGAAVYPESISVDGWVYWPERATAQCRVRAYVNEDAIGETALLFVRPDVCAAFALPEQTLAGFRFLARIPSPREAPAEVEIRVAAAWPPDFKERTIGRSQVRLVPSILAQRPYGDVVHPAQARLLHRRDIYGSGPPIETPGGGMLRLVTDYLAAGSSVIDVGCGAGAYGPALLERGHRWLGVEVDGACLEILRRRHLPHRATPAGSAALPGADREFDHALCIEVLEHIEKPDVFLGEIARVTARRALFSVPNIEVLPYLSDWQVAPWHLLEADHKNFFTRTNLERRLREHFRRVEVFSYAEHPLRTPAQVALHAHLFAVADK